MEIYQDNHNSITSLLNRFIDTTDKNKNDQQKRVICTEICGEENQNQIKEIDYHTQYAHLYFIRLNILRKRIINNQEQQHSKIKMCKVLESPTKEQILIIGTFYKENKEISKQKSKLNQFSKGDKYGQFSNQQDIAYIEDETGRMKIHLENIKWKKNDLEELTISKTSLPNGIVLGLIGQFHKEKFFVAQIILPGLSLSQPTTLLYKQNQKLLSFCREIKQGESISSLKSYCTNSQNDNFIALISGFNLNSQNADSTNFSQFKQFILGSNCSSEFLKLIKNISKIMIIGNMISNSNDENLEIQEAFQRLGSQNSFKQSLFLCLDQDLVELVNNIPVDIIPGDNDCASLFWPQNPLHSFFFPQASQHQNLHFLNNPFTISYNDRLIVGTSGKNIKQQANLSTIGENFIDYLEQSLYYQHIAPTAPETLECYPFIDNDPFILNEQPHIYLTGNSPKFETKLICEGKEKFTRLITVPVFSKTSSFAIVNLRNLDTFEIKLKSKISSQKC